MNIPIEAVIAAIVAFVIMILGWGASIIGIYVNLSNRISVLEEKSMTHHSNINDMDKILQSHDGEIRKILNDIKDGMHRMELKIMELRNEKN